MAERDEQAILREHLKEYLSTSGRSIAGLARKTSLAELTVRRILQGESKSTFETACKLLKVTSRSPSGMIEILAKVFPDMVEPIEILSSHPNTEGYETAKERFQSSTPACLIISLAATHSGTDFETVKREYGNAGCRAVEEMIQAGVLVEKNGSIRIVGSVGVKNMRTTLTKMKHVIDATDTDLLGQFAFLASEGWNKLAVNELQQMAAEFFDRVENMRQNPDNHGEYPVVVCGLVSRLPKKEEE